MKLKWMFFIYIDIDKWREVDSIQFNLSCCAGQ